LTHYLAGSAGVTSISRGTSVILLIVYGCYLFFQLKTHAHIYNAPSEKVAPRKKEKGAIGKGLVNMGNMGANTTAPNPGSGNIRDPDRDEEEGQPQLSLLTAFLTLGISTALVALCAEFMVGSM
jgi:Ca2+:H+ antiporter